jgi:hypothetical protein
MNGLARGGQRRSTVPIDLWRPVRHDALEQLARNHCLARKNQSKITQITQIKSHTTPMRIVWRFAQEKYTKPREAHSIPFRVICDLICVICVELAGFLAA